MDICEWKIFTIFKKLPNANPQKAYKYYGLP